MHVLKLKAKQLICMLLLAVVCVGTMLPVIPAQAAFTTVTAWYIQMSIDDQSWAIVGGVVTNEVSRILDIGGGGGTPKEGMRLSADMLSQIREGNGISVIESFDPEEDYTDNNEVKDDLVLTYPESFGVFTGSPSTTERTQAQLVLDSLLYDMNGAFSLCYDLNDIDDISDYQSKMVSLLQAAGTAAGGGSTTLGGCTFRAATSSDISEFATEHQSLSDYFVIEDSSGREQVFCYSMHKYPDGSGLNITWDMLVAEAFMNYACGVAAGGVYSSDPGLLESMIVEVFNSFVDFLSGALGLWTMDELIYNSGLRGGNSYAYGVFPTAWQSTIWTFFFISEIIAIAMLLVAIINNVLKKAASTVNPIVRANAMNQLLDIIKIVVLLIMLPLLLQIGLSLSATLSSMFAGALGDQTATERFSALMFGASSIGGVIMSILYLGAMIYFNAYYFLRSVIVAFLVIAAPLAVAMIGISEDKKSYYKKWQNALIGYVAIQPIHALILTILVIMPSTGRNIENIVAVYAMIPLGKMAKNIFLPDDNPDIASGLGDKSQSAAGDFAKGAAGAAVGAATGLVAAKAMSKTEQSKAEDRWRDENPNWNDHGGSDAGPGSGNKYNEEQSQRQQQNTEKDQAEKRSQSKNEAREEMKAQALAGGGEVNDSSSGTVSDSSTSGGGAEVTSDQADGQNKTGSGQGGEHPTDKNASGDGAGTQKSADKGGAQTDAEKPGDTSASGGGQPNEENGQVRGGGDQSGQADQTDGSSATQQQDDSVDQAKALVSDSPADTSAEGGAEEDANAKNKAVDGEPVADTSTSGDPYVDAYNRQDKIGKDWKNFKKGAIKDFQNPNSTLYQQAKASAAKGDTSLQRRIDSVNQQHREATKNKLKGMAMSAAGTGLFLVSGRRLGRDLMQAGMSRTAYASSRQAQLRNQMYDTKLASMQPGPAAPPEAPKMRRNMADMATKASASPNGGQDLTMTRDDLHEYGMDDVNIDRGGGMEYTTNENTDQETRESLSEMADVFANGSEEDQAALRASGYEMVSEVYSHGQPTGEYQVQTNSNYASTHGGVKYSAGQGGKVNVRGYDKGATAVKSVDECRDIHYENQLSDLAAQYKGVHNIQGERPKPPDGYAARHGIEGQGDGKILETAVSNADARGYKTNTTGNSNLAAKRARENREQHFGGNQGGKQPTAAPQPPQSGSGSGSKGYGGGGRQPSSGGGSTNHSAPTSGGSPRNSGSPSSGGGGPDSEPKGPSFTGGEQTPPSGPINPYDTGESLGDF